MRDPLRARVSLLRAIRELIRVRDMLDRDEDTGALLLLSTARVDLERAAELLRCGERRVS